MVRRRRARGFTLIELLISMALASIGLAGLLALQVSATRGNASSREFIEAISVAQERIEYVQIQPYSTLTTMAEPTCGTPISGGTTVTVATATTAPPTTYTRCTTVTTGANSTYIKVMVQWTDATQVSTATHYVTVETTRSP